MKFIHRNVILDWLRQNLPSKRVDHILRVEKMAIELAIQHGESEEKAAEAGLLHDVAKCYPPAKLLSIANVHDMPIHPMELQNPHLLHGPVGALEAQRLFGLKAGTVFDAIQNHTLGKPEMDAISCIVFLADSLEPGRGKSQKLQEVRDTCKKNLYSAVGKTCDYQLKKLIKRNLPIHPQMVDTRNWAIAQDQRKSDKLNR